MSCALTPGDKSTISKWIGNARLSFTSLYKASLEGGCKPAPFHQKCDNKGPTITVAYNNTGYVFGAYTSESFSSQKKWVADSKAFLFRLRQAGNVAYCQLPGKNNPHIRHHPTYGPCFGNSDGTEELRFFANDNLLTNGIITSASLVADLPNQGFNNAGLSWATFGGNNNNLLELEVYSLEAMPNLAEPWRKNKIQWNEKERNLLKEAIANYKPVASINVPVVNILLIGQVGAGKSSFFNTVNSVFHGYVTTQAVAGSSNHSLTTQYRTYRPRLERGGATLNFRLCDTMGIEEDAGMDVSNFSLIIGGNVRDRFQFYSDTGIGNDDPNLNKDVKLKDKIHVAAFVVDGSTIQVMSMKVLDKLKQIKKQVDKCRISSAILLTKIDKVCSMAAEDMSTVYHSPEIQDCVDGVAEKMGVPRSQVLVVKNYENEAEVDESTDIITLVALQQLLRLADSFFDDQIDLLDSSENETQKDKFKRNV